MKAFINNDEAISIWIEKVRPIFYNDKQRDNISAKNLLIELYDSNKYAI